MALQIANPVVVAKVQRLAQATGLSKTAIVEKAIDRLAAEHSQSRGPARLEALLAQLDRIPDRPDADDPLAWDDHGLPKSSSSTRRRSSRSPSENQSAPPSSRPSCTPTKP